MGFPRDAGRKAQTLAKLSSPPAAAGGANGQPLNQRSGLTAVGAYTRLLTGPPGRGIRLSPAEKFDATPRLQSRWSFQRNTVRTLTC
jgi:hypothetical protein